MYKTMNDFADAALYLLVGGLQLGFLVLGVGMFVAGLFGAI